MIESTISLLTGAKNKIFVIGTPGHPDLVPGSGIVKSFADVLIRIGPGRSIISVDGVTIDINSIRLNWPATKDEKGQENTQENRMINIFTP